MLFFISKTINKVGGSSFSAIDVVTSLLHSHEEVGIISTSKEQHINILQNNAVKKPKWIRVKKNFLLTEISKNNFLKGIIKYVVYGIEDLFIKNSNISKDEFNPKLIFVNSIGGNEIFMRFSELANSKSVLIVRESPNFFNNTPSVLKESIRILQHHPYIVFVSSRTQEAWVSLCRIEKSRTFHIPNCCNEEKVLEIIKGPKTQMKNILGFNQDEITVACIANVQYRKGQDIIIKYLDQIIRTIPKIKILFFGKEIRPFTESLKKQIKQYKLEKYVSFLGHRNDVLDIIYASDILLLPSRSEALPRVILEAMALKTLVIASDVDGIPEMIDNGETGYLFSIQKQEEIIDCFRSYINDKERNQLIVSNANNKYWSDFNRQNQINKYIHLINKLI